MSRKDGYKLKHCDPFYEIIPYIMPHRYDACNSIDLEIPWDPVHNYIKACRTRGIKMKYMSVLIASYLRLVSQKPALNRFVINKKIYARNHFCVSFVTLKDSEGEVSDEETVVKLYFNLDDDIFQVNEKLTSAIELNRSVDGDNSMDKLLRKIVKIPPLVSGIVGTLKRFDKILGLPFSVIDGSPFHTSLFITNMASIRMNAVYHHIYDFGTTGIFIAMGQPNNKIVKENGEFVEKRYLPIKVTTDERLESGSYYGRCFKMLRNFLANPEQLEVKPEVIVKDPNLYIDNPKFIVK